MPLLTWSDPVPHRPMRVLVAGTSGSGKVRLCGNRQVDASLRRNSTRD
jgi:hypothetical protein